MEFGRAFTAIFVEEVLCVTCCSNLALRHILSSIDLFLSYRTDSMDSRAI